jgi:hypothetical protein
MAKGIMSSKKLQVFVSSTYTDLLAERQAIVEAILMAGHIPAGMELFAAGDKSQLEAIRRWIKESDVFMVILGGRYGSIEEGSGKSYVQLEYEYALEQDKPVFAAVISDECLDKKIREHGKAVIETDHPELYRSFKKTVMNRVCRFFDDTKDLKLIVHESIPEVTRDRSLSGWIRGDEVLDPRKMLEEMSQAQAENTRLTRRISELEKKVSVETYAGYSFDELRGILEEEHVDISRISDGKETGVSLLRAFVVFADSLAIGVTNTFGISDMDAFVFFDLAPRLSIYGLTETKNINSHGIQRFQTSPLGNRFLARVKPIHPGEGSGLEPTPKKKAPIPPPSKAKKAPPKVGMKRG